MGNEGLSQIGGSETQVWFPIDRVYGYPGSAEAQVEGRLSTRERVMLTCDISLCAVIIEYIIIICNNIVS